MSILDPHTSALTEFPRALQDLVKAELAAGNSIVEICSGFPAPPAGASLKLAEGVTTRARESDKDLQFHERNSSDYSGEFTDAKRVFFVLEPPLLRHRERATPQGSLFRLPLPSQTTHSTPDWLREASGQRHSAYLRIGSSISSVRTEKPFRGVKGVRSMSGLVTALER